MNIQLTYRHVIEFEITNRRNLQLLEEQLDSYQLTLIDLLDVLHGLHYMGENLNVFVIKTSEGYEYSAETDASESGVVFGPIEWAVKGEYTHI